MTVQIQQQHSTVGVLQDLAIKLQELTNLLALPQSDTSRLIAEVEAALVSLQIEQLHQQAIAQKLRDFFPTPKPVIEKMLSLAQLKPGMKILEPSAGLGHICCEMRRRLGIEPDCFEISPLLRQGLLLQGFNIIGDDFLNITPTPIYDLILANPPFSDNGVARHTLRGLDWLRPGGRLVTIAHHYHLKPSVTDRAFFQWLKGFDACFYDCGQAFQYSDRPCTIPVQLIVINKPSW